MFHILLFSILKSFLLKLPLFSSSSSSLLSHYSAFLFLSLFWCPRVWLKMGNSRSNSLLATTREAKNQSSKKQEGDDIISCSGSSKQLRLQLHLLSINVCEEAAEVKASLNMNLFSLSRYVGDVVFQLSCRVYTMFPQFFNPPLLFLFALSKKQRFGILLLLPLRSSSSQLTGLNSFYFLSLPCLQTRKDQNRRENKEYKIANGRKIGKRSKQKDA